MKNYTELKVKLSEKIEIEKEKVKKAAKEAVEWVSNNKEAIVVATPIVLAVAKGTKGIVHSVDRKKDLKKEQELKELYIYDRSLGQYLKLRKKLSPSEHLEIERRKRNGESLCSILASMKLLA